MFLEKESPQDNGGAAYSETDTFGLCRAVRRVRQDASHSIGGRSDNHSAVVQAWRLEGEDA